MFDLLARGSSPQAMAGPTNVVTGIVDRMTDATVAGFVSSNVINERGATERLAQAFQTLVPEIDRQRQLLALAEQEVAASEVGQDENFAELWTSVETMMTSVLGCELRVGGVRTRALDRTRPRGRSGSDQRRPAGADRHLGGDRQRYGAP